MRTQAYVQSEAATGSLNVWAVAPELKPADRLQFYCDNVSIAWSFRDIGVTDQDIREKGLISGLGLSTASNGSVSGGRYWRPESAHIWNCICILIALHSSTFFSVCSELP
jgi:hypothetical protein